MASSCETLGVEPGCALTDRLERRITELEGERDEARERFAELEAKLAEANRLEGSASTGRPVTVDLIEEVDPATGDLRLRIK
jgi:predicted RNase H-like nuclease (RuvC/YqgF family)